MPNISVMKSSNFLKKEDVENEPVVTISGVTQENVAKQGAPEELRWCVHFHEMEKPMVCNSTNSQLIAKFVGSEETDDWAGKKIILYHDPSISYAGKLVGGIRVKKYAGPQQSHSAPTQRPAEGTYRPVESAGGSAKSQLKAKFKAHPGFNKDFKPDDISAYFQKHNGCKLDDLTEEGAQEALRDFNEIVETLEIPF